MSFVSVGDGSVNHAHFLSAVNMAEYSRHRTFKCPVVFAITFASFSSSQHGIRATFHSLRKQPFRKRFFFALPCLVSLLLDRIGNNISDNNVSISLPGYGWLQSEWIKKLRMPVYVADGEDLLDIWCLPFIAMSFLR